METNIWSATLRTLMEPGEKEYEKCSKILDSRYLFYRPRQTGRKQSDQSIDSEKKFVTFSPENQHFVWEQKEKCLQIFRTFTVILRTFLAWNLLSFLQKIWSRELYQDSCKDYFTSHRSQLWCGIWLVRLFSMSPEKQTFCAYICEYFLMHQFKHVFCVLKRTISTRPFFWVPTTYVWVKKIDFYYALVSQPEFGPAWLQWAWVLLYSWILLILSIQDQSL